MSEHEQTQPSYETFLAEAQKQAEAALQAQADCLAFWESKEYHPKAQKNAKVVETRARIAEIGDRITDLASEAKHAGYDNAAILALREQVKEVFMQVTNLIATPVVSWERTPESSETPEQVQARIQKLTEEYNALASEAEQAMARSAAQEGREEADRKVAFAQRLYADVLERGVAMRRAIINGESDAFQQRNVWIAQVVETRVKVALMGTECRGTGYDQQADTLREIFSQLTDLVGKNSQAS